MSSSFFGLQIGLSALRAHQRSLETISHNIANINTEGYSRQEVVLASRWLSIGEREGNGFIGAGVDVVNVQRYASAFLTEQIRREAGKQVQSEVLGDILGQVQAIFHEPADENLGATLDRFWASWKDLGTDPISFAARAQVQEIAEQLVALVRQKYQELLELGAEVTRRIQAIITKMNELAARIAEVDLQVRRGMTTGSAPNELLDQRDQLLGELGRIVRISAAVGENGGVTVTLGGRLLVGEQGVNPIEAVPDPDLGGAIMPRWVDDGTPVRVLGGELAGLLEARDTEIQTYTDRLHELTGTLITAVNTTHQRGYGLNNATGLDFFTGTNASNIAVAAQIQADLNNIAAASVPDAPGDGSQALAIAQLANQPLTSQETTLGGFYNAMVAVISLRVQREDAANRNQTVLLNHLQERRDALSGVSLDEEAVKLISSQRAYEAAARVITAMDEMLAQLIGGTGVVGR